MNGIGIALVPFLVILLIIVLVVGAVKKSINKKIYNHVVPKVFVGYFAVLLICLVLDIFHPLEKGTFQQSYNNSKKLEMERVELLDAAEVGKFNEINPKMLKAEWDAEYDDKQLNLAVQNGDDFNVFVVVKRKEINDGKIEAKYYKSSSSLDSYKINQIEIELSGDTLFLIKPEPVKINFSQFENPFTVNQFTGDRWFQRDTNFVHGQNVIYLQIPKNIQLVDQSNINFQYVN
jgi:hypothetical protein